MSTLKIIGIGNPDRGDDALGPAVIATLATDPPAAAELATVSGDMLALLEQWQSDDAVFLVDALAPGQAPGQVVRLDAGRDVLAQELANFASSHAFNLAEAIELGRALGRLPATLVVYGAEGVSFEPGAALNPAVSAAVAEIARRLREDCRVCTKRH
ncbi:MAG: hydrogenase maturation protease [Gammaproteobacteria bacterium]